MKKIEGKIGAYIVIMLIGAVVISSSISASVLNKDFVLEKNIVKPMEKQSMVNLKPLNYLSNGPGFIWMNGNGHLILSQGDYYFNMSWGGFLTGFTFYPWPSSTGGPAIPWQTSPTYILTGGYFNSAGLTPFHLLHTGNTGHVYVIGFVNSAFSITGFSHQ